MRPAWRSSNPRSPDRPLNTNSDGADDDESDSRYLISCRAPSPSTGRRRSSPARTTPTTNPSNCGSQLAAIQRNPTASPSCRPLKASTPTRARSRSPWLSSLPARATIPTSSWGPMVGEGGRARFRWPTTTAPLSSQRRVGRCGSRALWTSWRSRPRSGDTSTARAAMTARRRRRAVDSAIGEGGDVSNRVSRG